MIYSSSIFVHIKIPFNQPGYLICLLKGLGFTYTAAHCHHLGGSFFAVCKGER